MSAEWIKTAEVGDAVTCIKQDAWVAITQGRNNEGIFPEYGDVYVIACLDEMNGEIFLGLIGIDGWYWSGHFRPVPKTRRDLTVFTDMLKRVGKPVEETV